MNNTSIVVEQHSNALLFIYAHFKNVHDVSSIRAARGFVVRSYLHIHPGHCWPFTVLCRQWRYIFLLPFSPAAAARGKGRSFSSFLPSFSIAHSLQAATLDRFLTFFPFFPPSPPPTPPPPPLPSAPSFLSHAIFTRSRLVISGRTKKEKHGLSRTMTAFFLLFFFLLSWLRSRFLDMRSKGRLWSKWNRELLIGARQNHRDKLVIFFQMNSRIYFLHWIFNFWSRVEQEWRLCRAIQRERKIKILSCFENKETVR